MSQGEKPPGRVPRPLSGGPVKFGPFMLEARLAVGGTAEVYLARPLDPNAKPSRLVVKRLLPQFVADPEGRTMFEREGALHAAVHHENVVEVYGFGMADDEPWLAMELVDGCDLFRLLRRIWADGRPLPSTVAVFVARELLRGLDHVHSARDAAGQPMGIIHRDVTPSNVYLSIDGRVKLGDFGIARSTGRSTMRAGASAKLKGKFAYLSPEQVAGEPFDHRADLFSVAAVLSEMLIGRALFAGSGQLAVLLAIRDCRIDPLRVAKPRLPAGLFEVLEQALAKEPASRLPSANAFRQALAPFDSDPNGARAELRALVRWAQTASSADMQAVRDPSKPRAESAPRTSSETEGERTTGEYTPIPSFVLLANGDKLGPLTFARLVESLATGQVGRGDLVDYQGRGLRPLEAIEELVRFLPSSTATTNRLAGVAAPDISDEVSPSALIAVLVRVIETAGTGVLFAEGMTESRRGSLDEALSKEVGRKELYFVNGRLHHVSSNNASELLGEYLFRRKFISREELDFALAVLPRYGGRMGDTLIALGLVGSLEIFRAIRDQGRDRLIDLFQWKEGKLSYYSGQTAPHVEFPLALEIPPLLIAGLEAAAPGETPLAIWRDHLDRWLVPGAQDSALLRNATWPPLIRRLLVGMDEPKPLRDVLAWIAQDGTATASEALRALEVLIEAKLVSWRN